MKKAGVNHQLEAYCSQLVDENSQESDEEKKELDRREREEFFGADFENERIHKDKLTLERTVNKQRATRLIKLSNFKRRGQQYMKLLRKILKKLNLENSDEIDA